MKSIITTILYILLVQVATYAQPRILETVVGSGINANIFDEDPLKMSIAYRMGPTNNRAIGVDNSGIFYFCFADTILCKVEKGKVRKLIPRFYLHNSALQFDSKGYLYGFDRRVKRIGRQDTLGGAVEWLSDSLSVMGKDDVKALLVDTLGNLYYGVGSNIVSHYIYRVLPNGTRSIVAGTGAFGYTGDGGLAINAQISLANTNFCMDYSGNLLFANVDLYTRIADSDAGFNTMPRGIRKINLKSGIITTIVGGVPIGYSPDGVLAKGASLRPMSWYDHFCVDKEDNLYFTDLEQFKTGSGGAFDSLSTLIRKVDGKTGLLSTVGGMKGGSMLHKDSMSKDGSFALGNTISAHPYLAVDANGSYLCFKEHNNRFRRIAPAPVSIIPTAPTLPIISVYPNPVSSQLTVSGMAIGAEYRIVDIQGRVWQQAALQGNSIDVSNLPVGLYILQSAEGRGVVVKFEKQ